MDPLVEEFPSWALCHYIHNNPINLVDSTGMSAENPGEGDSYPNLSIELKGFFLVSRLHKKNEWASLNRVDFTQYEIQVKYCINTRIIPQRQIVSLGDIFET